MRSVRPFGAIEIATTWCVSRRQFIQLSATAGLLAGCRLLEPELTPTGLPAASATPTSTLVPSATFVPTPTTARASSTSTTIPPTAPAAKTATQTAVASETPVATQPPAQAASPTPAPTEAPTAATPPTPTPPSPTLSRVVRTHDSRVWSDGELDPGALRQMLDASITSLTGAHDADTAWASLFRPGERIAIKVNAIRSSGFGTHVPLVMAVAESLQNVGVPVGQIVIFDRDSGELANAGYAVNKDGPGVRCFGTDGSYSGGWTLLDLDIRLSDILLNCDALINIPILKQHGIAGISFAMKNHYGTFDRPGSFHAGRIERGMGTLNALPPIKDRTRLVIGDALAIVRRNWNSAAVGDSILMSFDSVAHDAVGLQAYSEVMISEGQNPAQAIHLADAWLAHSATIGLGAKSSDEIELIEVRLA